ncbi:hypothetical protein [Myxosarcina sp. GI1]|uniref:hypothetical protein n=1 Tax=Myxosarcina sp. GI1 TaxID=1541065 RepID=UPI000565CD98|nr:hypothetical protein [Myxosarcina sp. GI1]
MAKVTLQVRTRDNLLELLANNESGAWVVGKDKVQQITHVQVVNFEGTQMIEGVFDRNASHYVVIENKDRLVIKFLDGRIVNCNIKFNGENPVRYV